MIWSLIIFLAGAYVGHVLSPWIDGQIIDWKTRKSNDGMTDEDFLQ